MVEDKLRLALKRLDNARKFLDRCRSQDPHTLTDGTLRDAREGLNEAVNDVCKLLPPEVHA